MFSPTLILEPSDFPGGFQATRKITNDVLRQKMKFDAQGRVTAEPKLVDGRPVYSIPVQYIDDAGVDPSVHLSVFTPPAQEIPPLSQIIPTGSVLAVPYMDGRTHRMAWSLTAESVRVVQINAAPIAPSREDDHE